MTLAALSQTDDLYRFLVLLHVLTVIVGFGSTFVYPFTGNYASKRPGLEGKGISNANMLAGTRLSEPAIYAAGVLGLLLVIVGPHGFDTTWVSLSILIYLAALVFSIFVHQPNLKRMDALVNELAAMGAPPDGGGPPPSGPSVPTERETGGPPPQVVEMEACGKAAARNGGILHLAFAVVLVLMVWGARGGFA